MVGLGQWRFRTTGSILASADDETVKLWDVETGKMIATLAGHKAFVGSVVFSPDGLVLASGSADATVKLWDVMSWANFATIVHPEWVKSVAFSSDGTTLASATRNYTVELWNTSEWVRLRNQAVPDPKLRTTLQIALGKEAGTPITPAWILHRWRIFLLQRLPLLLWLGLSSQPIWNPSLLTKTAFRALRLLQN